ncbi:response regulator [Tumidithrix elongata RA019]|uniref:Circadian input-output histidine kinase CikA n=1 Tax=Tumidithrix elongata BACA0141 TaxID=2716417 RepID=A0AAW9PZ72_9CYAN|nr:response regulator [Tumidithrix elongata RA019]
MPLSNVRILVVEDNPADADLLEEFLSDFQKWQITSVDRLESAIALVGQQTFNVVLLDLSLPDSHGIETVTRLHSAQTSLPIVVLTGLDDEEIGLEALREGAQDYLVKGTFDDRLLKRVISYSIERSQFQRVLQQTNEQLAAINLELVNTTRLKDEFLANMSHELRTPLNAILGMSEGLQEEVFGEINERQQKSIALIERSGRHLLELINDILDISKIEAGKLELNISSVSVQQLCEASFAFVKQQAAKKSIHLNMDIQENLGEILCDDRRMKQVLLNLLNNAVKFTMVGGSVTLVVKQVDDKAPFGSNGDRASNSLSFSVIDTGIGISPEDMGKLFKPFVQIDGSLNRKYAGTGLGLTLVKQIIELHSGTIEVQSQPARGSCFTVTIPQTCTLAPISHPTTPNAPLSPSNHLVLIVEDSTSASDQLGRYLSEMNMEAIIHPRGEGTIEAVLRIQPAFIILDILLPNQSGWETLAQLKAHPNTKDISVVVISVLDERSQGLSLGAVEYLVKPITREQLRTTVEKLRHPPLMAQTPDAIVNMEAEDCPLILIAEDNQANIDTFSSYLESSGYRIILAGNGLEAVNLTVQQHPNLILMDIQMPEMDGLEAIRRIRANGQVASTPIVALTALAMDGDREACLAAGANDYLSKPIKLKQLLGVIQQLLKA